MSEALTIRQATCGCCGPWLVESSGVLTEFPTEGEARTFHYAERVRRLAAIHGITDERRINSGIANLEEPQ